MKHRNYLGHRLSIMGLLPIVFGFSLVFSVLFGNSSVSATSSITITLPSTPISLDVVGATLDGTFAKSDSASFTVSTTNSTGYTLNIKSDISSGNDGSGVLLYNGNDDSYTIPSLGGSGFPTGGINEATYRASSTYKNTWGYQPSMIDSSSNANFLPSPDTIGDTINVTNCANGTVNTTCTNASDTYSIAIGAKVDSTVRVGSYSNTFVILATANAIPYTIIYDDNTITNMPVDVNTTSQADTVNISSNVPAKDGYTFLGWCDTTPTTTNNVDSCPSGHTVYNPNGNGTNLTYTLNRQSATNNLHLYAMWSKSGGGGASGVDYVNVTVNFAGAGASRITGVKFTGTYNNSNSSATMTDIRTVNTSGTTIQVVPGTTYDIAAYYQQGSFGGWSATYGTIDDITNRFTTYTTTVDDTLTLNAVIPTYIQDLTLSQCQVNVGTNGNPANVGDNIVVYDRRISNYDFDNAYDEGDYTVRYINGYCWMTQNLRITGTVSAEYSDFTGNDFNTTRIDLPTYGGSNGSCGTNYQYGAPGYSNACAHIPNESDLAAIGDGATFKDVGVWYNYYSATAGTISGTSSTTVATKSICPSGWHIPTGAANNQNSEFYKIYNSTNSSVNASDTYYSSFNTHPGGGFGSLTSLGVTAITWWTATSNSAENRVYMQYSKSTDKLGVNNQPRACGFNIRCVRTE